MATFYYKTIGTVGDSFSITLDNCLIDLDPITDGLNVFKGTVTNANQTELDDFEARITLADGVVILDESAYNLLT